ncbi:MAG: ACP S-malonyltransferase [Clostridiales bacterium]|nr:ACP S-malonyltransferase [Clostridiales bacterium]
MGKIAFVFAGQGAQYAGMGQSAYRAFPAAKALMDKAESLREGTLPQCFSAPMEDLSLTVNAQPCLMAVGCACAVALVENGVVPDGLAGFSLGEIAALGMSGIISFEQAFKLVMKRAEFMHACARENPGGMAAVLKLSDEQVEALCEAHGAYPVNYNCPGQVVCAMPEDTMQPFAEAVKAAGGRALPLKVSGAFHSPLMKDAAQKLKDYARTLTFSEPDLPTYANATCGLYTAKEAPALLSMQVDHPVRFTKLIRDMLNAHYTDFIEVGPGTVLSRLIGKIGGADYIGHAEDEDTIKYVISHYREGTAC